MSVTTTQMWYEFVLAQFAAEGHGPGVDYLTI